MNAELEGEHTAQPAWAWVGRMPAAGMKSIGEFMCRCEKLWGEIHSRRDGIGNYRRVVLLFSTSAATRRRHSAALAGWPLAV